MNAAPSLDSRGQKLLRPDLTTQEGITAAVQARAAQMNAWADEDEAAKAGEKPTAKDEPPLAYHLLTPDEILAMPPLTWRVRGVLPTTGTVAIYGPSGAGKSFLVLDLAAAICCGADWFGLRTQCCPVVYVCLESAGGLRQRIQAWEQHRGQKFPQSFFTVIESFQLLDADNVRALSAAAPQESLVILDTLNRATVGADENSSRDMGEILEAARKIQAATGGLVVLVSHTGKDTSKGVRGHSSLIAALDAAVEVGRNGDNRFWKLSKAKEGVDGEVNNFTLAVEQVGVDAEGEPVTSCAVVEGGTSPAETKPLKASLQYALDTLAEADRDRTGTTGTAGVPLDAWRGIFYRGHTADNQDTKRRMFNKARQELVELGILAVDNDFYRVTK